MPQFRRSTLELNQPQERTAPRLSRAVTATLVVLASWATLSLTQAVPNAASTYYASPSGLPSNDGSFANPLDLATALSSQGPVRPGDTLWLRGGVYRRALSYDSHGDPAVELRRWWRSYSGTARWRRGGA